MNVDEFVRVRQATWQRLSDMLDGLQRGRLSQLSISELEELGRLYRAATRTWPSLGAIILTTG